MEIIIVTGMSGAGKSSALNILEDMGYYSMDNLPPILIKNFAELSARSDTAIEKIAVGLDIRGMGFLSDLSQAIDDLKSSGFDIQVIFLEANDSVLVKRYKELRRPHPMEKKGGLSKGIVAERKAIENIKEKADHVIDTSNLKLAQLKTRIESIFLSQSEVNKLTISVISFGFKHGILLDADIVFDARFIPNPYYVEDLKTKTGKDQAVQDFIFANQIATEFLDDFYKLINKTIPYYKKEGKQSLVIGIGCTGGQHRSVALTEALGKKLEEDNTFVYISHRDERFW